MTLNANTKYVIHLILLISWIFSFEVLFGAIPLWQTHNDAQTFDPIERYGAVGTVILYVLRLLSLLVLPQCICNTLGWLLFNGFKDKVQLKASPLLAPFVCFRVVTKGDYPKLVKNNVETNLKICFEAGLENFIFEIVTDKPINFGKEKARVREVIVPSSYRTKTGARFKARALQYCLEDDVNILRDEDWIVHLDEETLLSLNSVCGILNFCEDGKHQFGQGVITYANGEIINWITTLSDSFRVADDMGKLRFQFHVFHKPLFGWKGSFVVTQVGAERKVSFDHGMEGSIAEDCFFSMIAYRDGYTFDFIEGEMYEKSPFTFWDFLQQRKRWLQGIYMTVHSRYIPLRCKIFLASSLYAWVTMPLTTMQLFICPLFPLPKCLLFDLLVGFVGAVNLYMYVYGVIKSFSAKYRKNSWRLLFYTAGALITIPFNIWIENVAVLLGMFGRKDEFYVVNKDVYSKVLEV
ncbi:glycosyl transferase family group 2 domain-containing protein [Ditylenchus destructor]|nr:glycosyl transferase family group 2 domain-containing protein [Ditylenchus destructor]